MLGHDIIVIGTSAGGLKALGAILGPLPADLDAVIFIRPLEKIFYAIINGYFLNFLSIK